MDAVLLRPLTAQDIEAARDAGVDPGVVEELQELQRARSEGSVIPVHELVELPPATLLKLGAFLAEQRDGESMGRVLHGLGASAREAADSLQEMRRRVPSTDIRSRPRLLEPFSNAVATLKAALEVMPDTEPLARAIRDEWGLAAKFWDYGLPIDPAYIDKDVYAHEWYREVPGAIDTALTLLRAVEHRAELQARLMGGV